MCLIFTCGEHTFRKEVEGYEGVVCRCYNCGNHSGRVIKSHPWFTLCFIVSSLPPLAAFFSAFVFAAFLYSTDRVCSLSYRSPSTDTKTLPATSATSPSHSSTDQMFKQCVGAAMVEGHKACQCIIRREDRRRHNKCITKGRRTRTSL